MQIKPFEMERYQSIWEHVVEYNLSESGVHPLKLNELVPAEQLEDILNTSLGYNQTNGSEELRSLIAAIYPGAQSNNVLVTTGSAEANFLSIWRLIESGDEIALMLPNYMQIRGIARAFGAEVKPFFLVPKNERWQIDWVEFEKVVSSRTKLIAIKNNFDILAEWIKNHEEIFECIPPVAGAITLLKHHLDIKSNDLVFKLRDEKSVLIVPGEQFLMDGYLRIGFGCATDQLTQALSRVSEVIRMIPIKQKNM